MEDMTIFNLHAVNKGALKATVSIRLMSGSSFMTAKFSSKTGCSARNCRSGPSGSRAGRWSTTTWLNSPTPRPGRPWPRGLWPITRAQTRVPTSPSPQRPHHPSESARRRRSNPHRKK